MRRNHIDAQAKQQATNTHRPAGALPGVCCSETQRGLFSKKISVMAGAAQVPKHDWSLPTRPGLEIEDVRRVGNISHGLFLLALFLTGGNERGNRQEKHLQDDGLPLPGVQPV